VNERVQKGARVTTATTFSLEGKSIVIVHYNTVGYKTSAMFAHVAMTDEYLSNQTLLLTRISWGG